MGWKVIFSPDAFRDLEEIVTYIAIDNPTAAEELGMRLVDRVLSLQQFPEIGARVRRAPRVRKLTLHPYVIYYRLDPSRQIIEVMHFRHGYRQPPML